MKLIKLFLPMLAVMLLASGCTKEYVTHQTYYGSQIQTIQFNITPSEWVRLAGSPDASIPGANNYLYCTKNVPEIDETVFEQGTVQAFAWNVYDASTNSGAWNTLPFVYPLEVYVQNGNGGYELLIVSENLRFEWEQGKVTFIIQDLDGFDPEDMISTISIKVCVSRNM